MKRKQIQSLRKIVAFLIATIFLFGDIFQILLPFKNFTINKVYAYWLNNLYPEITATNDTGSMVGVMHYDIWKDSSHPSGWSEGKAPWSYFNYTEDYSFTVPKGMKAKSVSVRRFDFVNDKAIWNNTRSENFESAFAGKTVPNQF